MLSTGLSTSIQSLTRSNLDWLVLLVLLFDTQQDYQPDSVILALRIMMCVPVVLTLISFIAAFMYPIDSELLTEIQSQLSKNNQHKRPEADGPDKSVAVVDDKTV
jgi:Na+/melibiose symporter-like transporter